MGLPRTRLIRGKKCKFSCFQQHQPAKGSRTNVSSLVKEEIVIRLNQRRRDLGRLQSRDSGPSEQREISGLSATCAKYPLDPVLGKARKHASADPFNGYPGDSTLAAVKKSAKWPTNPPKRGKEADRSC
jgi:hypothetical protein